MTLPICIRDGGYYTNFFFFFNICSASDKYWNTTSLCNITCTTCLSLAVETPAKHEYDSMDLTYIFSKSRNFPNRDINGHMFSNPHPGCGGNLTAYGRKLIILNAETTGVFGHLSQKYIPIWIWWPWAHCFHNFFLTIQTSLLWILKSVTAKETL